VFEKIVSNELAVRSSSEETSFVRLDGRTEKLVEFDRDISDVIVSGELVPVENREVDVPSESKAVVSDRTRSRGKSTTYQ
jgi:hypothetical protein